MLSELEFNQLCLDIGIPGPGRDIMIQIRSSQPSRNVKGGKHNVVGKYPSRKMRRTIQFESHTLELPAVYGYEYNEDFLEMWDQPAPFKLSYTLISGRSHAHFHTADFFVIRKDSAGWEEWKYEEELVEMAKNPNRVYKDDNGQWRCPPGEKYAEQFGLYYKIRSSEEINQIYFRNLVFLEDFLLANCSPVSDAASTKISSVVKDQPGITLTELLNSILQEGFKSDDVYIEIVRNSIYVDLEATPLAARDHVYCFADMTTANAYSLVSSQNVNRRNKLDYIDLQPGKHVVWDGRCFEVKNKGKEFIYLTSDDGKLINLSYQVFEELRQQGELNGLTEECDKEIKKEISKILHEASTKDLKEANRRYKIIELYLNENSQIICEKGASVRTIRRWTQEYKKFEQLYGHGYLGIIPKKRTPREPGPLQDAIEFMIKFISDKHETFKQQKMYESYSSYKGECTIKNIYYLSYKTFTKYVKLRPRHEKTTKTEGKRAAYQVSDFYHPSYSTPRHGDRIFERVHMDHTQVDIELNDSNNHSFNLGKPWLTFLMDAFSRYLLVAILSFDPPSYRTCMIAIRECVRLYGRLMQELILDNGPEFHSVYLETLLAYFKVTPKYRPSGEPRNGSVLERLFNTTNTQFVYNLTGTTQITKKVRLVTTSNNPKNLAIWTLPMLNESMQNYVTLYNNNLHSTLGRTPSEEFQLSELLTGSRENRQIPYDRNFMILTMPSTRKTTAKVQPGPGAKINSIYYWHDFFRNPLVEGTQIGVRFDPYDIGIAYAYVLGDWVECHSEYYSDLSGHTEKEMRIALQEMKRRDAVMGQHYLGVTAARLAEFLRSTEHNEEILRQLRRAQESKNILRVIPGGNSFNDGTSMSNSKDNSQNSPAALKVVYDNRKEIKDDEDLEFYEVLKI